MLVQAAVINSLKFIAPLLIWVCCSAVAAQAAEIKKELLYDKHTLADTYSYQKSARKFQWDKIGDYLAQIDSIQTAPSSWGVLQNYKNENGRSPLAKKNRNNKQGRSVDNFNVERNQSVPLYTVDDLDVPERYGQDGDLVKIIKEEDFYVKVESVYFGGEWMVPKRYVHILHDNVEFKKAIFIDRVNQNIATLEKVDSEWLVRSMNPATTGVDRPPYAVRTPTGIFVVQQKKPKMMYYRDGTTNIAGYAPHASRFSTGAYVHGVPVNLPRTKEIEFSPTLGTIPRSHKCVRSASSHAKFIYDWAPVDESLVVVFD